MNLFIFIGNIKSIGKLKKCKTPPHHLHLKIRLRVYFGDYHIDNIDHIDNFSNLYVFIDFARNRRIVIILHGLFIFKSLCEI